MRGQDAFLFIFFALVIGIPIFMMSVRVVEKVLAPKPRFRNTAEIDAYIKKVTGEE